MANEREVIIRIKEDGSAEVVDAVRAIGNETEQASTQAKGGLDAVSIASQKLAANLGMPIYEARQLGNAFSDMTRLLGGIGTVFGLWVGTLASLFLVYRQAQRAAAELREENIRSATAIADKVIGLENEKRVTSELITLQYNQYLQEREIALRRLPLAIDALIIKERQLVVELNKNTDDAVEIAENFRQHWFGNRALTESEQSLVDRAYQNVKNNATKLQNELENLLLDLRNKQNQINALTGQKPIDIYEFTGTKNPQQMEIEARKATDKTLLKMQDDFLETQQKKNVAGLIYNYNLQQSMNAARLNLQLMFYQQYTNIANQALDAYVAITGKRNAVIFAAQKAIAIAQIWVDTQRAAVSAMAAAAPLGPVAAAAAYAQMQTLGYISMGIAAAAALGQLSTGTWKSAGGGGGGAVGTYPVSPGTGQPSTEQPTYVNIYINNPLSTDNWQEISEKYIVPALNANGERGVQLNPVVVRA